MKVLKNHQGFISSLPNSEVKALLLYGKDPGMISYYGSFLANSFAQKGYLKTVLYASDIKENPNLLENTLQSSDLFSNNQSLKLVVVKGDFTKLIKIIETSLSHLDDVFVVIEAGDLAPSSKLRLFFDKQKDVASIACYQESSSDIAKNALQSLEKDGYKIEKDALMFLASKLGNNKMVTEQEIEKLKLYKLHSKDIKLEDVVFTIGQNSSIAIDKIINACFTRSFNNLDVYLEKETIESVNGIAIIRSLISHCLKMIQIKLLLREKKDFESAVLLIKPAIFYKQKAEIRLYINSWSLKKLLNLYTDLIKCEITIKKHSSISDLVLQNMFIKIVNS